MATTGGFIRLPTDEEHICLVSAAKYCRHKRTVLLWTKPLVASRAHHDGHKYDAAHQTIGAAQPESLLASST